MRDAAVFLSVVSGQHVTIGRAAQMARLHLAARPSCAQPPFSRISASPTTPALSKRAPIVLQNLRANNRLGGYGGVNSRARGAASPFGVASALSSDDGETYFLVAR